MLVSITSTVKLLPFSSSRSSAGLKVPPAMQVFVKHQENGIVCAVPLSTVSLTPGRI